MTYDGYAMFEEGCYHIAHGNCQEAVIDRAERVCKQIGARPLGFVAGVRNKLTLNCEIFTLEDLKQKS